MSEPRKAQAATHFWAVDKDNNGLHPLQCFKCEVPITGPRLRCINCPRPVDYCLRCEPTITMGGHATGHSFVVHLESTVGMNGGGEVDDE